jgi:multiple antibiotic resistance protein
MNHAAPGQARWRLGLALGVAIAIVAGATDAFAQAPAAQHATYGAIRLSPKQVFLLLFLMLGPIKILVPFRSMSRGLDAPARRRMATRGILFSAAALAIAGLLGRSMLENFNMPPPVLALTGGIVLFLVALKTVMEQFSAAPRPPDAPDAAEADPRQLAITPLAFPTIVTPYGIAATIVFMALAGDDLGAKLMIGGVILVILAVNWVAMVFAHVILRWLATPLQVLAVVLGVTQIGIGLTVILRSLAEIGVFTLRNG